MAAVCPEVKDIVNRVLKEADIVPFKMGTSEFEGRFCACDVQFDTSILRKSIVDAVIASLESSGYTVKADLACGISETVGERIGGVQVRMNVFPERGREAAPSSPASLETKL